MTTLVVGGSCTLGVVSLLAIAWVTWMLADPGRAVDYRRRVDSTLHRGGGDRSRWFTAVRSEAAYARRYVHDAVDRRRDQHRRPGWR